MTRRKIIFDTDPGIDDAFAIIAAMNYEGFDILGLCTVAGNKGLDFTTTNALKLIKLMDYNCMVYKGASTSLLPVARDAKDTHGSDGLGGVTLGYDLNKLSDVHAVDFILESVKNNPGEIEIIAIGPVTNIALAIQKDRETMKKVKAIYTMGGGIYKGNVTPYAEFNYWYDAISTEIMFSLGKDVPIHMIGLDITHASKFTGNDVTFIKLAGGELGEVLFDMVQPYLKAYWNFNKYVGGVIHDLLAVIYAIDPSVCPKEGIHHVNLRVPLEGKKIGATITDLDEKVQMDKNAYVPMLVDSRKYKEKFMEIVFGEDVLNLYQKHCQD